MIPREASEADVDDLMRLIDLAEGDQDLMEDLIDICKREAIFSKWGDCSNRLSDELVDWLMRVSRRHPAESYPILARILRRIDALEAKGLW